MRKLGNTVNSKVMKLLYYSFFHSHLEFSSIFLLATKKPIFNKIVSLQKQAIRLLLKLPRKSHTAEAFYTLDILPFEVLCKFNAVKFMTNIRINRTLAFRKDWLLNHEISGRRLRNSDEYYVPKGINSKVEKLPMISFAKIMNENHELIQLSIGENLQTLRTNFLKVYYNKNECYDTANCFICSKMSEVRMEKDKREKRKEKRIEKLIKEKGIKKKARIEKVNFQYKGI